MNKLLKSILLVSVVFFVLVFINRWSSLNNNFRFLVPISAFLIFIILPIFIIIISGIYQSSNPTLKGYCAGLLIPIMPYILFFLVGDLISAHLGTSGILDSFGGNLNWELITLFLPVAIINLIIYLIKKLKISI